MIKKIDGCTNNPEKSPATKIGKHIPCGHSVSTMWDFGVVENKQNLYHGEECMKKFCSSLRGHGTNVINFERKKMLPLTKKS